MSDTPSKKTLCDAFGPDGTCRVTCRGGPLDGTHRFEYVPVRPTLKIPVKLTPSIVECPRVPLSSSSFMVAHYRLTRLPALFGRGPGIFVYDYEGTS